MHSKCEFKHPVSEGIRVFLTNQNMLQLPLYKYFVLPSEIKLALFSQRLIEAIEHEPDSSTLSGGLETLLTHSCEKKGSFWFQHKSTQ